MHDDDPLDYPRLIRDAFLDVVRRCLGVVAERGLPGDHHFYVSFRTTAPGVGIAGDLVIRYPDEMTVIIQHQYRDLEVFDDAFAVSLSFGGKWRRLEVPWTAITSFADPAAQFMLPLAQLADQPDLGPAVDADLGADDLVEEGETAAAAGGGPAAGSPPGRGPSDRSPSERGPSKRGPADRGPADRGPSERGPSERGPAEVISIDAFRKR